MKELPQWIEKAKEIHRFHVEKKKNNEHWTIVMTAKALRKSEGLVGEDLLIAKWLRTHSAQLERIDTRYEALKFIKKKKKEQELDELE